MQNDVTCSDMQVLQVSHYLCNCVHVKVMKTQNRQQKLKGLKLE